jgi:LAGLIDADG endonuclease
MAVKMFLTRRQSAWNNGYNGCIHQRLHVERPFHEQFNFNWWLVGFTDGDGTFSIVYQNQTWNLTFKISQSSYNLRVLYFIKKNMGAGQVTKTKDNMAHYRIGDQKLLKSHIFPIFDNFILLTSKFHSYQNFKKAFLVLQDKSLSREDKDKQIQEIMKNKIPVNYVSPFFRKNISLSKSWIVGFIEAEGSFYVTKKDVNRYVHGFGISQKLDKVVLESIKKILGISNKIQWKTLTGTFSLDTTNSRAIENINKFFAGSLKGMKAVEFKIWSRSLKYKGDSEKLYAVQLQLRKLRQKRFNLIVHKDDGIVRTM